MEVLRDIFTFIVARKKYVLAPIIIVLLLLGLILVFGETSGLGAFVYTLF